MKGKNFQQFWKLELKNSSGNQHMTQRGANNEKNQSKPRSSLQSSSATRAAHGSILYIQEPETHIIDG